MTASEGYKAGGVNLTIGTPNFRPEKNRVYEAGFKTQFLDNQLRVNGDVFYSRYSDIQLSSLTGGLPVTQNAARGKSYGAELEVTSAAQGMRGAIARAEALARSFPDAFIPQQFNNPANPEIQVDLHWHLLWGHCNDEA